MTQSPSAARRILITGASGFVGQRLLQTMAAGKAASDVILGLSLLPPLRSNDDAANGVRMASCNLLDPPAVHQLVKDFQPTNVVHLAAQSSVKRSFGSGTTDTWNVNFNSTLNLVEAIRQLTPEALLVFSSTVEVYGKAFQAGEVDESTVPNPQNAYARSKLACEHLIEDVFSDRGKAIIVRPTNHSGPGQPATFVLPDFASQIAELEVAQSYPKRILVGNLDVERDFLHVDDVVRAYCLLLGTQDTISGVTRYNISSGQPIRLKNMLEQLISISGQDIAIEVDPDKLRKVDVPRTQISMRALEKATGWKPQIPLNALLTDILDAQRAEIRQKK
ncbi:GDP-4-dehydro-6-deoxy-D-mannose reductase [Roseibium hamelinense]|uniref:GDP-4-dehydro-6-deoxy-D-mannose reductase n=1 Tax=Roseibium hamelinense TaxID=150831 RepID=A0A562T196_9HYPH|nr:GDP-mannose 4,6-dehydratase [Roseibium hamelinense]MTI44450.1 NAD-dependent epimerase/dehydratase family protein [Roseibium hamelinense]TWI87417.1 GDP-4-dehydro-6-deoxy-D-mannose reductase [Roseibium hamelinense]